MWQPTRVQWSVIAIAAALLVFGWPPDQGHSLGVKAISWLVDPTGSLPILPSPLPMALDDDGDAVAAHDAQEAEYYRIRDRSPILRWRMALKQAGEPLDAATERQLLVGVAVFSALAVWKFDRPAKRR
jgi:hypothetical protein